MLSNRQAAEEAVQEVFLHVIRAAKKYEPRAKFGTWVYRIMHNYGIDLHRRNRLRKALSLDHENEGIKEELRLAGAPQAAPEAPLDPETLARFAPGKWNPDRDKCELYNLDEDFSQADDVAEKYPDKVRELTALFWSEAEKYQVLPLLGEMANVWGFPKGLPERT